MFDTTCANISGWRGTGLIVPDGGRKGSSEGEIGVLTWEEHCVECGQPECFKTCKFFDRSYDGKCRRFDYGIVYEHGLHICTFRPWGKLEAVYTGRKRTVRKERTVGATDRVLCNVVRTVNRLMAFIPGRIGAITIYRRIKLWLDRLLPGDKTNALTGIVMRVWASRDVKLHFTAMAEDREIFSSVIELRSGWSDMVIPTPSIRRGTRLLLFSTEDESFTLAFKELAGKVSPRTSKEIYTSQDSIGNAGRDVSQAKFVKCVAWDLDNTLWKGILVEDGEDKLVLNQDAVRVIKELDKRGIVHTVLSKNDYDVAWAVLEKFGVAEYFIFPHINWKPKSGNIVAAAKEININLNTFAFVDDSSFERGEVGEKCPQVRIFKDADIVSLLDRPEFNPPISAESAGRRLSYQKEMQRVAAAAVFDGDYKSFLESCKIELSFFDLKGAESEEYERCYELIQRSNQLTLTGNRYSQEAFKELTNSNAVRSWGIRCKDKFGDYGIIGCVVVSDESEGLWRVREFVMSCRVAKKGCEAKAIGWVKQEVGAKRLVADIVDTGRNGALREAFKDIQW